MNTNSKLDFINERPLKNKYCIMTTIHMLEVCKESYNKTLSRLSGHLTGLTNKYYNESGEEIPPDVREEITDLNVKICECSQIIKDIDSAINVIDDTCMSEEH